jgi:hypothetical protein
LTSRQDETHRKARPAKLLAESNLDKHGVFFDYAARMFLNVHRLNAQDTRHNYREERRIAMGMMKGACLSRPIRLRLYPAHPPVLTLDQTKRLEAVPIDYLASAMVTWQAVFTIQGVAASSSPATPYARPRQADRPPHDGSRAQRPDAFRHLACLTYKPLIHIII